MWNKIISRLKNRDTKAVIMLLFLSIFLEIFVCNMNSLKILDKEKNTEKKYLLEDVNVMGGDVNWETGDIIHKSEHGVFLFIEITDIDTSIGTLYVDFNIPNQVLNYTICYTDETSSEYYWTINRDYVPQVDRTKWTNCHFNGKSAKMILRLENLPDGYTFSLNEIDINKRIPFHISLTRLFFIFVSIYVFYAIRHCPFWKKREKIWVHNLILSGITLFYILLAIVLYRNSMAGIKLNLMYNVDFIDALINKKLELGIPVSEELKALENPYDTSVRQMLGIDYSWDTAYYNGKYYCYFGVVPAIMFFVPYKLLTGSYLQCDIVVITSYIAYLIFLDITFLKMIRFKFPNIYFSMEALSLIILNAATNLFYFATEPSFYMMFYSVGLMLVSIGFCIFTFWYTGERKNKLALFLGALCMALAVGCRPPLLLYTLLIIPFGIKYIKNHKKKWIVDMAVLVIPYLTVAIFLAMYNYLRFDSFVEFGQSYQLTAQDQLHNHHSIMEIPNLLWLGFFQPLNFSAVFPFVTPPSSVNNYAGHFFKGDVLTSLLSEVPVLVLIFSPYVWKRWKEENDRFSRNTLLYTMIVGCGMYVYELLNAGVEWRYCSETAPVFVFIMVFLMFNLFLNFTDTKLVVGSSIVYLTALYSFLVTFLRGIGGAYGYMLMYHPEFYYYVESLFSIWK